MPPNTHSALAEVLYSGQIAHGPVVGRFESLFQEYIGNPQIISTSDVSTSLTLCLYMAGVKPSDEVIASPMSCLATNEPVRNLFADIVWCDINPLTGSIDPNNIEHRITARTKAILVFHWAGNPVDMEAVCDIARRHSLKVIDDASEALGADYYGKKIGNTCSDYTTFSFYANRHMTTGEGGAIAFADPNEYERGRWLKRYGIHLPSFRDELGEISPKSMIPEAGLNTYMNSISAAIGVEQMAQLPEIVRIHQENGTFYDNTLAGVDGITLLERNPQCKSAYWVYTLLAENRDGLLRRLREKGIYVSKVHLRNDVYTCFSPHICDLPGVEHFQSHTISIPCGWWVTPEDRQYIVDCIKEGW